ncbi:chemotaxis protein CheW [Dongia deserti]|uniref:chemotaxis protein CheW n=1 Tax=Dongia deserti TaxID=2268030 RepID=UPI00254682A2|nr:chemotaxis protein CheW [Dongia deserti]
MGLGTQLFVFGLEGHRYALHLETVDKVVPAVHVTPLPKAPEIITGIVNIHGEIVPVVDVRRRFALPPKPRLALSDRLVIARTRHRPVAVAADTVSGVLDCPDKDIIATGAVVPDSGYIEGVVRLRDGLILIHDLETFLSLDEEEALSRAIADA